MRKIGARNASPRVFFPLADEPSALQFYAPLNSNWYYFAAQNKQK